MKKLYKVTATFEYVVLAEEGTEYETSVEHVSDALSDMNLYDVDYDTEPYTTGSVDGWTDDCEPYGGAGKTTAKWMEELK